MQAVLTRLRRIQSLLLRLFQDVTTETVERWWPLGSDEQSGEVHLLCYAIHLL